MYKYDRENNELVEISETTFHENKILERENIEEWIRKNPDTLGEELLIVGHEYDNFDNNERLDLLAIDKDGKLVIIEIKRDRTGSKVDFQSLKYCSYCSQLVPQDIIDIYCDYLKKFNNSNDPKDLISDFLDLPQGSEDKINEILNNSQRFIIIGKEIDKRILSVCAWLYENGIEAKCLSIKPYLSDSNEIFIDFDQIIPPFQINDFYIKKKEGKIENKTILQEDYIIEFFYEIVEIVKSETSYRIYYQSKKSFCLVRTGNPVTVKLSYYKRGNNFSLQALIKDKKYKSKFEEFYNHNHANMSEQLGHKVEYEQEGPLNPDRSYIRVNIEHGTNEKLKEKAKEISKVLIIFSKFFIERWI